MKKTIILFFQIILITGNFFPIYSTISQNISECNPWTYSETSINLLIITPIFFVDELQSLRVHKESHDIRTKIVSLDDIYQGVFFNTQGRDNPEKIKYFLKNAKEHWDTRYVILVGGKEECPARYVDLCSWGEHWEYISDLYYADIYDAAGHFCSWDSNQDNVFSGKNMSGVEDLVDLFPDISVGRFLCKNKTEVRTVVNKIIEYENHTYGKEWFKQIILCGGDDARLKWREKIFAQYFDRDGGILWEGEYIGERASEYLDDFSAKKLYATGLFYPNIQFLSVNNINLAINNGAGFLLFVGHGNPSMAIKTNFPFCPHIWLPFPFGYTTLHSRNLSNGEKLPVTVFAGCSCGDFDTIDSPIAWEFVKKENGGSIASFGGTTGTIILFSTLCTETFTGHLALNVFRSYSDGINILGDIWSKTISDYLNDEEAWQLGNEFSELNWKNKLANNQVLEEWILFGDSSLKIGGYP